MSDINTSTTDGHGVPYRSRLKKIREATGSSPEQVARLVNLSLPEYYDLENCDGELTTNVSIGEIFKISVALKITPHMIFEDNAMGEFVTINGLVEKIIKHLKDNNMGILQLEEKVGFVLAPVIDNPEKVLDWNVDCLRFVCSEVGVNWLRIFANCTQRQP